MSSDKRKEYVGGPIPVCRRGDEKSCSNTRYQSINQSDVPLFSSVGGRLKYKEISYLI